MKLTKTLLILFTITIFSTSAFSQQIWDEPQRTTFGVKAGFDLQNIVGTNALGDDFDGSLAPAFHFGVVADVPVATDFYIQPGLLYKVKGTNQDASATNNTTQFRIHYLEVPVSLHYKPILANGRLILGFGPYLSYGVGGKAEIDDGAGTESYDIEFTDRVTSNSDNDVIYFRRWDAGANFAIGYEFLNGITAQLNTQLGLMDINPEYEGLSGDETSIKNIGFGLSIGYKF